MEINSLKPYFLKKISSTDFYLKNIKNQQNNGKATKI